MTKEGKDFEWRAVPGSNAKARHFFTKAEKAERAKPKPKAKTTSRASPRKRTKEAPVTPLSKPSKITTKSLDPIAVGARAALARDEERERMESYDPVETKASKERRRERNKRVPGRAILRALSDALSYEGEKDPKRANPRSGRAKPRGGKDMLRSPSRSFSAGGAVKANCGASRAPRRKMK